MANLILYNASILSIPRPSPGKTLVAIENNVISGVAANDALRRFKKKTTTVIDCTGMTVIPGLIDSHLHLHAFAESLVSLHLTPANGVSSIFDIQSKIRNQSQNLKPGTWIRAKGYHEFDLKEKRHPTRHDLDAAAPDHPVKLSHRSGHAHVLNSLALKHAGITIKTPDPPQGLIERSIPSGEPNGVLFEMGEWLSKKVPPLDDRQMAEGVRMAGQNLISMGITSVQDASYHNDIDRWNDFSHWMEDELFLPRINMFIGASSFADKPNFDLKGRFPDRTPRILGVKIILDHTTGNLYPAQSDLNEMVLAAHRSGMQVSIHAVEEMDIDSACQAVAYAQQAVFRPDSRHRIEHCSVCRPKLAERIASLGIIVATQPAFIYYNGDRYLKTVPQDQINHLYAIGTLLKKGVTVSGSSDCPVVSVNPFIGMYAAVSRATAAGDRLAPQERITLLKALQLYTTSAAKAAFEETVKGSVSQGKLADLVVVKGDLAGFDADGIKAAEPVMTILDGKIVWDKGG